MVSAHCVTKYYGKNRGIDNLNLEIEAGTITGLVGPNGAGKTTLIRALLGLISVDSGNFYSEGRPLQTRKGLIGYCSDNKDFHDDLGVKELFTYAAALLSDKNAFNKALSYSVRFHLDTSRKVNQLSRGNLKKVQIILAFMGNHRLVVLDEPTNGLDPLIQNEFYLFLSQMKGEGKTVLLSSHQLYDVERICDSVAFIRDGTVMEHLVMDELHERLTSEIIARSDSAPPTSRILPDGRWILECADPVHSLQQILESGEKLYELEVHRTSVERFFMKYYTREQKT